MWACQGGPQPDRKAIPNGGKMIGKRTIALGGVAATLLGGGAALAARGADDGSKTEQAILSDAAKRLGVKPGELESALSKAEDAQLDQAVRDGRLTRKQADAIKRHRQRSGHVLGMGPGGPGFGGPGGGPGFGGPGGGPGFGGPGFGGPGRHGPGGPGDAMGTVAKALGISESRLFSELRDGRSLAQVAKAHGKSLAEVKSAVADALKKRLDGAVERGDLTRSQADDIQSHLSDMLDHFGERPDGGRGLGPPPAGPPGQDGGSSSYGSGPPATMQ
jgi:hypothetical protein